MGEYEAIFPHRYLTVAASITTTRLRSRITGYAKEVATSYSGVQSSVLLVQKSESLCGGEC